MIETLELSPSPLVTTFIGERYNNAEQWSELVAPPYDVISPEQRRIYRERSEHNIVRLILPDGNGNRYTHAATILQSWRDQNVLVQDPHPAVYVVRQEFETPNGEARVRTGVIGAVAVEPYDRARVRPHEKTHKGPKDDRLALMQSTRSMFEALLLMSRDRRVVTCQYFLQKLISKARPISTLRSWRIIWSSSFSGWRMPRTC